jgi:hypothetical protein
MKTSRRGFFGLSAGAAIAGPAAAKSVLKDVATANYRGLGVGSIPQAVSSDGYAVKQTDVPWDNDAGWIKREIEDAIKHREDLIKRSAAEQVDPRHAIAHRIDGLRSVSAPNRARMIQEDRARRELEFSLSWTDRRIAELKKKLGVLGVFL